MKSKYLEDLLKLLKDYKMDEAERQDIVNDYSNMYDSWIDKGLHDDEVEKKLGHPRSIIRDLTEGYKKIERPLPGAEKVIAVSPLITTVIFLILGIGFDLWHPGWLVFFIIPITAIVMSMGKTKEEHLTTALSPFIATIIFLWLGFGYDLWHPAWMVFLIIPVLGIWNSRYSMRKIDLLTALSPFATGLAYIILGLNGYWVEGWVVFMLIPILGILNYPNKKVVFFWELFAIVGIIGYLYIGLTYEDIWNYAALSFTPFVLFSIYKNDWEGQGEISKAYRVVIAGSLIAFLITGYFFNLWIISWLFFLAIPVYAILTEAKNKARIVAITPFIALVIFVLSGYIFDIWHLSWIIFIIIPITAILIND